MRQTLMFHATVDLRDWIRDYAKACETADEDLLVSREYWNLEKGHREPYPGWGI